MKQNISYWHQQLMLKHGATVKHVLKSAVLLILAALVLETFVFNFNYFRTAGYHTTNLDNRLSLTKTPSITSIASLKSITSSNSRTSIPRFITCGLTSITGSPHSS